MIRHSGTHVGTVLRRAEFFRKGGAARDLVRGKRWLLLSSWLNLDRGKRSQLNALFVLEPAHSQSLPAEGEPLAFVGFPLRRRHAALPAEMDRPVALAAAETDGETSPDVAGSSRGYFELLPDEVPMGVVEAINGNIKALLRRGRGYRDMNYLLLKAQRLAATKTEFVAFQKAA
jgi:hypothetical protein